MKKLREIYKPYDFSDGKCFIVIVNPNRNGYFKIEQQLPTEMKIITGIFVSMSGFTFSTKSGYLSLSVNDGASNCFQQATIDYTENHDCSQPFPMHEVIKSGSLLQGYYLESSSAPVIYSYILKIYLHYRT